MYTKVNYADVDPVAEGMHFLRDPLDCEGLGITVVDVPAGWTGKPHDHADEGHEEVYLLLEGEATIAVEGEDLELAPGDAVRVAPDATRRVRIGDADSTMVVVGAP